MNLSKKEEKELLQVYETWWHSYLNGDVETYDHYLDEDIRFVGSTDGEEFLNKKETTDFFQATADQLAGKAKLKNIDRTIETHNGTVIITDLADAFILDGSEWVYYARFRFTSMLRHTNEGWRFFYQHFSTPDLMATEGETLGHDKITAENLELRSAIKRRTAELELKNRELEIETALERVRAKVTSMSQSSDLLDIVVTMRNEFTNLGHRADYFWHMMWLPDKYEKAMTSGDGTRIGNIMELPRDFHHRYDGVSDWESGEEPCMILALETEEAVDYIDKMITLGKFHQVDPNAPTLDDIRHIQGITFIMARTSHGEIGYSLPGVVKNPPKEDLDILVRFAGVFDLAHRRFLDLQQSENQAREVQIELGLEKVRSSAMAMQDSSELSSLVSTVFKELALLDFALQACIINLIDADNLCNTVWMMSPDVGDIPDSYLLKFEDYPFHDAMMEAYLKREAKFIYTIEGAEKKVYDTYLFTDTEFRKVSKEGQDRFKSLEKYVCSFTFSNFGGLQTIGEVPLSDENLDILARFGKVFDLTYTRFNDLKLAEAQAREAEIELALERVRARTMAMQQSEELAEVATVLFQQVKDLGIPQWTCGFNIWETGDTHFTFYPGGPDGDILPSCQVPLMEHPIFRQFDESKKRGDELFVYEKEGEIQADHYRYMHALPGIGDMLQGMLDSGLEFPSFQIDHVANFAYGNLIFITYEPYPEMHDVFKRFAKVFEQTYRRFLDLQKAEAQAKEAQIEAALERIRSKSMSMSSSKDIGDTVATLFDESVKIGHSKTARTGIGILDDSNYIKLWSAITDQDDKAVLRTGQFDMSLNPSNIKVKKAWERGDKDYYFEMKGPELIKYYKDINESANYDLEVDLKSLPPIEYRYQCFFKYGIFYAIDGVEISEETKIIFNKFAQVFEQIYTRFLDLRKAEAQAREAHIETALERVRSRSIGMQNSEELKEVIQVIFDQLGLLNINAEHAGIVVDYSAKEDWHFWVADTQDIPARITVPYLDSVWDRQFTEAKIKGKDFFTTQLNFEEKNKFYEKMLPYISGLTKKARNFYLTCPGLAASTAVQKDIGLYIENFEGKPYSKEENSVLHRFGMVFQQTYTRFLDLQKAEAQARESQIEMALEKVRSRTMAMQNSSELPEAANNLFLQVQELGIPAWSAGYCIWEDDQKSASCNMSSEGIIQKGFSLPTIGEGYNFYEPLKNEEPFHVSELGGKALVKHYDFMKSLPIIGEVIADFDEKGIVLPSFQIFHIVYFTHGYLMFITYEAVPQEWDVFKRFGKVFEQTYTRFLDLKKAEAQAKEAQIETALEKVRSRTMAMQKGEELQDVVVLLYKELITLGVANFATCGYVEINEKTNRQATWVTSPGGDSLGLFHLPLTGDVHFDERYKAWKKQQTVFHQTLAGKERRKHLEYAITTFNSKEAEEMVLNQFPDPTVFYCFNFSHGYLHLVAGSFLTEEEETLLARFTKVFERTYARFLDLKKAEAQAREARIETALERVRSRTMAMHNSSELAETAAVLFQQLKELGVDHDRTNIGIVDVANRKINFWLTTQKGNLVDKTFPASIDESNTLKTIYKGYEEKRKSIIVEQKGVELKRWISFITDNLGVPYTPPTRNEVRFQHVGYISQGMLIATSTNPLNEESVRILERFAAVFEQTYTRFLDLQKAEAQAREAQIEAALERTRNQSMQMQHSDEIKDLSKIFHEQLHMLNIPSEFSYVWLPEEDKEEHMFWATWSETTKRSTATMSKSVVYPLDKKEPYTAACYKAWASEEAVHETKILPEETAKFFDIWKELLKGAKKLKVRYFPEGIYYSEAYMKYGCFGINIRRKLENDEKDVLHRFAVEFERAYTRFLDLQKAEVQARESKIEAAMERIRAASLAMHESSELLSVIQVISNQLEDLKVRFNHASFGQNNQLEDYKFWTSLRGLDNPVMVNVPNIKHPMTERLKRVRKEKMSFYTDALTPKQHNAWNEHMYQHKAVPWMRKKQRDSIKDKPFARSLVLLPNIFLVVSNSKGLPFSDQENQIIKRVASVFEQAYTRFLDLQKAEAQTRESQIEAALEKVRARTMAMQSSSELREAANLLFIEVQALGINAWSAGYNILSTDKTSSVCWMCSEGKLQDPFPLYYTEEASFIEMGEFLKSEDDFMVQELKDKDIEQHYGYMQSLPELKEVFQKLKDDGLSLPTYQINHLCKFSQGYLLFITYESVPEAHDIFKRFTKVFEQTYTRFLDLQKAENQSKETQIELALERVRASTMAMHKSEQLAATAQVLFEQFDLLGIIPDRISIAICNERKKIFELWATDQNGTLLNHGHNFSIEEPTCMAKTYKAWKQGEETFVVDLRGKELKDWVQYVKEGTDMDIDETQFAGRRVQHSAFFSQGYLMLSSHVPISDDMMQLLLRFAKVFQQSYTRFQDLQNAEKQAREAIKRASVDRVRGEIASMRTATDLGRITPLVWNELTTLDVPFIRCGVFIMDEEQQEVQTHLSTPDGKALASFKLPFEDTKPLDKLLPFWRKKEMYTDYWDRTAFIESTKILMEKGAISSKETYLTKNQPDNLHLHFLPFLQGMLYVGSEVPLTEDELSLVQNLADAFSSAYARYEDFNKLELANKKIEKTLVDLKQAQSQLVQSEKMASLGELTAGIAHEIQNPLNFVNNFAEVSQELMQEMHEEIDNGELEEAAEISQDIEENLKKIHHHGQRASEIVKGMLQHSRSGSGVRELTNINVLADEYLRLAYHGLRAKDKSFNASFKLDIDENLPQIEIVPQDFGRVLLNLINNAFYAVDEKKKQDNGDFEPEVKLSTKKIKSGLEIKVADNGNGIPQKVLEKIFQPFFTTKPTGKGTGLGLSLSYDIIVAHGGELKVETKEGQGSQFIIIVPV